MNSDRNIFILIIIYNLNHNKNIPTLVKAIRFFFLMYPLNVTNVSPLLGIYPWIHTVFTQDIISKIYSNFCGGSL